MGSGEGGGGGLYDEGLRDVDEGIWSKEVFVAFEVQCLSCISGTSTPSFDIS